MEFLITFAHAGHHHEETVAASFPVAVVFGGVVGLAGIIAIVLIALSSRKKSVGQVADKHETEPHD